MAQLHAEQTNAYRLFHGSVEGESGWSVDRYGDALLVQTFHRPLPPGGSGRAGSLLRHGLPGLPVFYNDRSQFNSRISNAQAPEQIAAAHEPRLFQEMGVTYRFQARTPGRTHGCSSICALAVGV